MRLGGARSEDAIDVQAIDDSRKVEQHRAHAKGELQARQDPLVRRLRLVDQEVSAAGGDRTCKSACRRALSLDSIRTARTVV